MRKRASHTVRDAKGEEWAVHEARTTPHGFDLLLGKRTDPNLPRRGGAAAIPTEALVAYMLEHRRNSCGAQ